MSIQPFNRRSHASRSAFVAALLLLAGVGFADPRPGWQAEQRPVPQFGADVELVLIDLTAIDADGNFMHGLEADDFRIFEEGEEMDISFFALERFAAPEVETGIPTVDDIAPLNRYIVLYVDGINTIPQDWLRVRPFLESWIEDGLQPNDYVLLASLHPSGRMRLTPEFSRDKTMLLNALMQVEGNTDLSFRIGREERMLSDALGLEAFADIGDVTADAARLRQGAQLAVTFENTRRREVKFGLDYLNELADHLDLTFQVPGPKVVIMVSGGLPEVPGLNFRLLIDQQAQETSPQVRQLAGLSTFQPMFPEAASDADSLLDLEYAIGRFNRANYLFYTIDARQISQGAGSDARQTGFPLSPTAKAAAARNEQFGLIRIADGTGGLAFYNNSDLEGALRRVQEDTAYRYVIGYGLPDHDAREVEKRKFYRVEVESLVPGVEIRAREGYVDTGS